VLRINSIDVAYGTSRPVLSGVSLRVGEKELVAIIGANGAGKSTLFKTLSGFLAPVAGTIEYGATRISGLEPSRIVKLGICQVPEGRQVFPLMTVKENLEMGAFARRDRAKVSATMESVFALFPRLKERVRQAAGTLSGGEQQMLAIGRALMSDPKVLLLDEPSLGLSPVMVELVAETVQHIHAQGIAILLSEQNAVMSLQLAERAYVLELGKIVLEGTGQEMLNNDEVRRAYLGL
jgi:branched-chain amino acid transport system ATP-binding protein